MVSGRSGHHWRLLRRASMKIRRRFELGGSRAPGEASDALHVFHEHVLNQSVRFLHVGVVVPLADLANLMECTISHHLAGFAKGLERVFGLARHHDVSNDAQKVALTSGVGEIARTSEHHSDDVLSRPDLRAELRLILLEHALMLAHLRNVARAEIAEPVVFRLIFMGLQRAEKYPVLHDGAVDLALQKLRPAFHVHYTKRNLCPRRAIGGRCGPPTAHANPLAGGGVKRLVFITRICAEATARNLRPSRSLHWPQ